MKDASIVYCPFTRQPVTNSSIEGDYFQCTSVVNNYIYNLKFSKIENWPNTDFIPDEDRWIYSGMLFNNEWPIEEETIITTNLLEHLKRLELFPREFNDKLEYFLLKCYNNGGAEYRNITVSLYHYQEAYAKDSDELLRIINGLESKGFIENLNEAMLSPLVITLTEEGIKFCETNLIKQNKHSYFRTLPTKSKPTAIIISTEEDSYYSLKLQELLFKEGISVSSNLLKKNNEALVHNLRSSLYDHKTGYVFFIKSYSSDRNNTFGSILDITIEAHSTEPKLLHDYLYILYVDDSSYKSRPRITNYQKTSFEFRLTGNRKRIIDSLEKDWERRISPISKHKTKYNFPSIELKDYELKWLKAIYQKFLSNQSFQQRELFAKMWKEAPNDFEPFKLNNALAIGGTEITLLGIWHLDSNSSIFEKFDTVIRTIQEKLQNSDNIEHIRSEEISILLPEISKDEIYHIFKLLSRFGNFTNGFGHNEETLSCNLSVNTDKTYKAYKNYLGIERYMWDLYNYHNPDNNKAIEDTPEIKRILTDIPESFKTQIVYHGIKPVMGVTTLAKDLSQIIKELPPEKGQMVGVFGKWGRGKTYFLTELWNDLKSNRSIKFVKTEYHAWKFQETPASWAYLYEVLANTYFGRPKWYCKPSYLFKLTWLNYKRLGIFPIIKLFFTFMALVAVPFGKYSLNGTNYYFIAFPMLEIGILALITKTLPTFSIKAEDVIKKYTNRHSFKNTLGIQADIQEEIIKLLKVWIPVSKIGKKKILLIVEDIDRCNEDKILQNIDALRIMLEDDEICKRIIIVTAIDERILKNAIKIKYRDLLEENRNSTETFNELASEYLDKIFIIAIKLGLLTMNQKSEFLEELLQTEPRKNEVKQSIFENPLTDFNRTEQKIPTNSANLFSELNSKVNNAELPRNQTKDSSHFLDKSSSTINNLSEQTEQREKEIPFTKFEKLTLTEISLFEEIVSKWSDVTPRKIKIFYYRYLLCKNLLIKNYLAVNKSNPWQSKNGTSFLIKIIHKYSILHDPDQISLEKKEITSSSLKDISVTVDNEIYPTNRLDYLQLLEAIELVIAY